MTVEANSRLPIHQRNDEIGLCVVAIGGISLLVIYE
jgi:hypothetical protein